MQCSLTPAGSPRHDGARIWPNGSVRRLAGRLLRNEGSRALPTISFARLGASAIGPAVEQVIGDKREGVERSMALGLSETRMAGAIPIPRSSHATSP